MEFNWIASLILAALVGNFLITTAADLLNLKALSPELPAEFAPLYRPEDYAKSQHYTRSKTLLGLLTTGVDLAVLLIFWRVGGFNWMDLIIRGFGLGEVATGLLYLGSLALGKALLSIPFSLYATFVIEERYGFNRTTPRTFVLDLIKGAALAVVLGGPLLTALLVFFQWAGAGAWLYGWGLTATFIVALQFIAPTWIMPLFNTFTPLGDGELKDRVMAYAGSVGFTLEGLYVIDGSKRSSKSNAFFTGFGRHKRIALYDTLIERHSVAEVVSILAHEIGHYQKRHILQGMAIGIVHLGFMLYLLSLALGSQGLFDAFGMEHRSVYSCLIFFGLLLSPLELVLTTLMNLWSRHNEFEADRFVVETGGGGDELILALRKLSLHNLANLTPHPFYVTLHYSHPPLMARIAAIRATGRRD